MRIGLYGLPSSGKTTILNQINFIEVVYGSDSLKKIDSLFDIRDESEKERTRKKLALQLKQKSNFIIDGHYAFGSDIVFTKEDGNLFDTIIYLYISPELIKKRMSSSEKNRKYLSFDIETWQNTEISRLRDYCHENMKDFYVIDNPPDNQCEDISQIISFIKAIIKGYSCKSFANNCATQILNKCKTDTITLLDGDKTLTIEDSSHVVFGYTTHLYDGNFYTGYQSWKQNEEFNQYSLDNLTEIPLQLNEKVKKALNDDSYILTSGHSKIWQFISDKLNIGCFYGIQMSAETKLYTTKLLQDAGKYVIAYGDGMNDYFMLKQADEGYLVAKQDGSISKSLNGKNLEGLSIV